VSIPKTVSNVLVHFGQRQLMIFELCGLQNNGTWDLLPLTSRKSVNGCRWIFAVKVGLNDNID